MSNNDTAAVKKFKARAKNMLKDYKAGDAAIIQRVHAIIFGGDVGLMKVQYVIAREAGFKSWGELARADEARLEDVFAKTGGLEK